MSDLDYSSITPDQLELKREPRKSKFALIHTPTGTVGSTPVTPAPSTEARFRRPTILPKENRHKDMLGYIEGRGEDGRLWTITGGENPRNEYLEAICQEPEALRICFEGPTETAAPKAAEEPAPPEPQPDAAVPEPVEAPATEQPQPPVQAEDVPAAPEAPLETPDGGDTNVQPEELEELDNLLAGFETDK